MARDSASPRPALGANDLSENALVSRDFQFNSLKSYAFDFRFVEFSGAPAARTIIHIAAATVDSEGAVVAGSSLFSGVTGTDGAISGRLDIPAHVQTILVRSGAIGFAPRALPLNQAPLTYEFVRG